MIKQLQSLIPHQTQANLKLKAFALTKVPLLFLTRAHVKSLSDSTCEIDMPFSKIIKNHWGSVYFGALAIGADACVGLLATSKIDQSGQNVSLVFKSFKAAFLKRAIGRTTFVCDEGEVIDQLLKDTLQSDERQHKVIKAYAVVNNEHVAEFELELSLKKK